MKFMKKTVFGALTLTLTLISMFGGVGQSQEVAFGVAEAQYERVEEELVLDGVVEAVSQATVNAQTSGRVVELNFDVDDVVNKGDVLLRLRDVEQRAEIAQARAALNEAQASLEEAQAEFNRVSSLFERGAVARAEYDQALAVLNAAKARVEAARARRAASEEQLGYTVVRAPFSGIVTARHVELGEIAQVGEPLMSGLSLDVLRVVTNVPQSFIDSVRQHRRARILLPDGDHVVASESMTIFPYADPQTHTFRVRARLPGNLQGVYPGMFVKVGFVVDAEPRLLVPLEAVAYRGEVAAVYVVGPEGRLSMRQVRTGRRYDGGLEILAGLEPGERVALDPVQAGIALKSQQREAGS